MPYAETATVQQLIAVLRELRRNPSSAPALPFPPVGELQRRELIDFARNAPLTYGFWRAFKWLYKQAENSDETELLSALVCRLDAADLFLPSSRPGMARWPRQTQATDIAIEGDQAYVTGTAYDHRATTFLILSLEDPKEPRVRGSLKIPELRALVVRGNFAYVLAQGTSRESGGLRVIDVSDPTNPQPVGFYDVAQATALTLEGDTLCILSERNAPNGTEIHVLDLAEPTRPRLLTKISLPGAIALSQQGGFLYVAVNPLLGGYNEEAGDTGGLAIFDLTSPSAPRPVSPLPISHPRGVLASGDRLFVTRYASANACDFLVYTREQPDRPRLLGQVGGLPQHAYNAVRDRLCHAGSVVYFKGYGDLCVIDISDPASPVHRKSSSVAFIDRLVVRGEVGYGLKGYEGVQVVDCSHPALPVVEGDVPDSKTIGYMKRRARRLLRRLAKEAPERYVSLAFDVLSRRMNRVEQEKNWVSMDLLFGNSARYVQNQHGRGSYQLSHPRFVLKTREERAPEVWNAHQDRVRRLLQSPDLAPEVYGFALRVLWGNRVRPETLLLPHPTRFLESQDPLLLSLATRSLVRSVETGQELDPKTLAKLFYRSNPDGQRRLSKILTQGTDNLSLMDRLRGLFGRKAENAGWKRPFAQALLEQLSADRRRSRLTRRQESVLLFLSRELRDTLPGHFLREMFPLLLDSRHADLQAWALEALQQTSTSYVWDWLLTLAEVSSAGQERALAVLEERLRGKQFESYVLHRMVNSPLAFVREAGWRLIAVSATPEPTLCDVVEHVLSQSATEPALQTLLQSPYAFAVMERVLGLRQALLDRLLKEPALASLLSARSYLKLMILLPSDKLPLFVAALTDAQWSELAEPTSEALRAEGKASAFWHAVRDRLADDPEGVLRRRILEDARFTALFLAQDDESFLDSANPTMEALLFQWVQAHEARCTAGSPLLLTVATHPLPTLRSWGLARVQQAGLSLGFALLLLESEVPAAVALGKTFFESVLVRDKATPEYALALCDSPKPSVQAYGREYLSARWNDLSHELLLAHLTEHASPVMQAFVAERLRETSLPSEITQAFDRQVLRAKRSGRQAKELVKARVQERPSEMEIATLLQMARGSSARDAEWALQQLAKLALEGHEIEGLTLGEVTGI